MALTERLALLISAHADEALVTFDRLGKKMTSVDAQSTRTGRNLGTALTGGAVLAGLALGKMVTDGVRALEVQQATDLQTQAVLKSTGAVAGLTAKQVGELAEQISHYSAFSVDAVKASENVLLSFTAVRNSAGAGNDIFDRADKAAADLSARFGTDLTQSAKILGRALQDPAAGMTALTRSGVAFDAQTKAQIKSLAQNGQLLEAQKLLLDAVNEKVSGAAAAAGKGAAGGFAQFHNALEEIDKTLAKPLLAPLTQGLHDVADAARIINEHPIAVKVFEGIVGVGATAIIASKALGILASIKNSELVSTVRATTAREASVAGLNAEAVAAQRDAVAQTELNAARAAGGGIGGGPVGGRGFRAGLAGSTTASLAVFAADAVLVPKALDSLLKIPSLFRAREQGNAISNAIRDYNAGKDTYGQQRALQAIGPQVDAARAAAAKGDFSKLESALQAVNKALSDNVNVYSEASYNAREYALNTALSADVAAKAVKTLAAADVEARAKLRVQAGQTGELADPTVNVTALNGKVKAARTAARAAQDAVTAAEHRLERVKDSRSSAVADAEAALARAKTTDQVAAAEQRLEKLRGTGGAAAGRLTDAENSLARAKERAAQAGDKLNEAEGKANAATGLSAKQVLANATANAAYERSAAGAAQKLVRAGLSKDVLNDLITNVESKAPGTLVRLAASISPSLIKGLNARRAEFNAYFVSLMDAPNAAVQRAAVLGAQRAATLAAKAYATAWEAQFAATPLTLRAPVQGPPIAPGVAPYGPGVPPPSPVQGPPSSPGGTPYGTTNYNLNGPVIANDPAQLRAALAREARLAQLGLG